MLTKTIEKEDCIQGAPASFVNSYRKMTLLGPIFSQLSSVLLGSLQSFQGDSVENNLVKIGIQVTKFSHVVLVILVPM